MHPRSAGSHQARCKVLLLAGVTALVAACSGCSGSGERHATGSPIPSERAAGAANTSIPVGPTPRASQDTAASTGSRPSSGATSRPSPSEISIPPNLCAATDTAQNTADAYMGALSAGDEKQALACVLPGSVPVATTRALVATVKGTAVYLPRAGVDGPSVFGYAGNGKSVDVTVTREPDGTTWVTKVMIR